MKKRKLIGWTIAIIVVLLIAAVGVTWAMIDHLAKRAVEDGGQYALGVPTTVDSVNLSLLGGTMKMDTLNVSNPPGYKSPHLMRTGQFNLSVDTGSVFSDTVVVPVFEIDGLDVNIEPSGLTNNISVVLENVKKVGGDGTASQQPAQDSGSSKKVRVDRVVIRNVVARVHLPIAGQPLEVKVAPIELSNVSSDNPAGVTVEQLISRILPAIVASVLESGKGILPADLAANLNTQLASTVGALGGQASQMVQQVTSQVSTQVQATVQQVQGQAQQAVQQASEQAQGALQQVQRAAGGVLTTQPAGGAAGKLTKPLEGLLPKSK